MDLSKVRTLELSTKEFNDLLAILAYVSGKVEYKPEATQHQKLKGLAFEMHSDLVYQDENESD